MTTPSSTGITMLARVLAVLQGIAIVTFGVLLYGADEPAPVGASPAATPPKASAVAAVPDSATPVPAVPPEATLARSEPTTAANAGVTSDAVGTLLYGRVIDEAGQPVTEGWLSFMSPADNKQFASVSLNPRQPCFAIAGLTSGDVAFRARVTGYKESSGTIAIPAGTVRQQHDIVLTKSWEIMVKVLTPEGKPFAPAFAELAKDRPNLFRVEVGAIATPTRPERDFPLTSLREITGGVGRWRGGIGFERMRGGQQLPADVTGVLELDSKQPLWISAVMRHRVLMSVSVEPGQSEVILTVGVDRVLQDLCTIRGRIVDAVTKEPVTEARVGFGDRQSGGGGGKVDEQGRFEVRDLRPGLLTIEIYAAQRTGASTLVLVQPGQELDLGDVPVFARRTITGRCEGVIGKAEGCRIACTPLDPPPHASMRHEDGSMSVEADGSFKLYLVDGRYRLRASGAGGAVMEIDTRTLPEPLVLQLVKESSLRLDVQSNGEPYELAVFDAGGREIYRRDLQHGWKFALPFLPGDYRIELKNGSGKVDTRRITLSDAGADLRVP